MNAIIMLHDTEKDVQDMTYDDNINMVEKGTAALKHLTNMTDVLKDDLVDLQKP